MDDNLKQLVAAAVAAHPGPWSQSDGYGDNGGRFRSIVDGDHNDILDGETGNLSEPVFNLLLKFPEIAKELLYRSIPAPEDILSDQTERMSAHATNAKNAPHPC